MRSRAALASALLLFGGCGAMAEDAGSLSPQTDTTTSSDTSISGDASTGDTSPSDTAQSADTSVRDTDGEDEEVGPVATTLKQDPDYLVPAGVAERRHVALGDGLAAWVERDTAGGPPRLMVWEPEDLDTPPRTFAVPNLFTPRQLVVGDEHLFYVDDRYGDPDLFALVLASGAELPLVTTQGAQERPTAVGTEVAWEDCRGCVSGDDGAGREIYRRDLGSGGGEVNLTADGVEDRSPAFGTLADGQRGLAWVTAGGTLRVVGGVAGAIDVAWPVDDAVAGVAMTDGVLAWRPRPLILNPDSMMPSDVYLTMVDDGATFPATAHAERLAVIDPVPRGAAGRLAWLESAPGSAASVLRVINASDQGLVAEREVDAVIDGFGLGSGLAAFVAPRADNGGLPDVWIFPIPPTP